MWANCISFNSLVSRLIPGRPHKRVEWSSRNDFMGGRMKDYEHSFLWRSQNITVERAPVAAEKHTRVAKEREKTIRAKFFQCQLFFFMLLSLSIRFPALIYWYFYDVEFAISSLIIMLATSRKKSTSKRHMLIFFSTIFSLQCHLTLLCQPSIKTRQTHFLFTLFNPYQIARNSETNRPIEHHLNGRFVKDVWNYCFDFHCEILNFCTQHTYTFFCNE